MTIKKEVIEKLSTLTIAGFGLVAALAWNDAVRSLFAEEGPLFFIAKSGIWVYAIVITIIAVLVTISLTKLSKRVK